MRLRLTHTVHISVFVCVCVCESTREWEAIFRMSFCIPPQQGGKKSLFCNLSFGSQLLLFCYLCVITTNSLPCTQTHFNLHIPISCFKLKIVSSAHSYLCMTLCRSQVSSPSPGSFTGVVVRWWPSTILMTHTDCCYMHLSSEKSPDQPQGLLCCWVLKTAFPSCHLLRQFHTLLLYSYGIKSISV